MCKQLCCILAYLYYTAKQTLKFSKLFSVIWPENIYKIAIKNFIVFNYSTLIHAHTSKIKTKLHLPELSPSSKPTVTYRV